MRLYRPLLFLATLLAFGVISLGAYVRLSDAGLGCPDWPGCYGHLIGVPEAAHEQSAALQAFPDKPVQAHKAWKEMVHRYFAGTLGLLVALIAVLAWRYRRTLKQSPVLPTMLVGVIGLQALLGMWTVTLLLKPVIVSAHLLGGMTTLALLVWLLLQSRWTLQPSLPFKGRAGVGMGAEKTCASQEPQAPSPILLPTSPLPPKGLCTSSGRISFGAKGEGMTHTAFMRLLAALALLVVAIQIALGGWVSSNYAALACSDFPTCLGVWQPEMDFAQAFQIHRELGQTANGELLSLDALTAIHWTHRVGALIVSVLVGALSVALLRRPEWRNWGLLLGASLLAQIGLGIANVLLSLPLPLAVAHNAGAAILLTITLALNFRLWQGSEQIQQHLQKVHQ